MAAVGSDVEYKPMEQGYIAGVASGETGIASHAQQRAAHFSWRVPPACQPQGTLLHV
jgi:hypothetical protein